MHRKQNAFISLLPRDAPRSHRFFIFFLISWHNCVKFFFSKEAKPCGCWRLGHGAIIPRYYMQIFNCLVKYVKTHWGAVAAVHAERVSFLKYMQRKMICLMVGFPLLMCLFIKIPLGSANLLTVFQYFKAALQNTWGNRSLQNLIPRAQHWIRAKFILHDRSRVNIAMSLKSSMVLIGFSLFLMLLWSTI